MAAAIERFFEPLMRQPPRVRFALFLALCLLLHALLIAFLFWQDWLLSLRPPIIEETPIEVIAEPPPQEQPAPPPPEPEKPPEPEQQKQEQQKPPPPPPPPQELEDPAFDAPKAESQTKSETNAEKQQQQQQAPRQAPEKVAPKDEKPEGLKDATDDEGKAEKPDEAQKETEDKSDAEVIERAQPKDKPVENPEAKSEGHAKKGEGKSIADQVAALPPLPNYDLAAPPKASPVGGGQAKTTYLTILYGLIMPHMHIPPRVRASGMPAKGVIAFYIDEVGNLTHQAIYRSSGAPDLDAAAVAAVRRAAPFPPPPRGLPHSMLFTYATK